MYTTTFFSTNNSTNFTNRVTYLLSTRSSINIKKTLFLVIHRNTYYICRSIHCFPRYVWIMESVGIHRIHNSGEREEICLVRGFDRNPTCPQTLVFLLTHSCHKFVWEQFSIYRVRDDRGVEGSFRITGADWRIGRDPPANVRPVFERDYRLSFV